MSGFYYQDREGETRCDILFRVQEKYQGASRNFGLHNLLLDVELLTKASPHGGIKTHLSVAVSWSLHMSIVRTLMS